MYSTINPMYTEKVIELLNVLTKANILHETEIRKDCRGFIIYFPDKENRTGDVILHDYSYGHELGCFEGYGKMSKVNGDVYVFTTPEEVVKYAKEQNYERGG